MEVPARLRGWRGIWLTPWIDEEESLRAVHGAAAFERSGNLRRADSVEELIRHLADFGALDG